MIKDIHLIYNDNKKIINGFDEDNFELDYLYELINNNFGKLKKNIDIYLKVKYDDETYELYIENQNDLNEVFNIKKNKEIIIYIIDKNNSFINDLINKKKNIESIVSIIQPNTIKLSQIYNIKYEPKYEEFKKNQIKNGFKYSFRLLIFGKDIPITSFLFCIPDNNEIFFLPSKTKNINYYQDVDNEDIYSIYEVNILFKNINSIESKIYKLNYQLYDDKEGYIGDEKGTLSIKIIDE